MRWVFLGLVLSGCFLREDQCDDLIESVCLEKSEESALSTSDFCMGEWIEKKWWEMFEDEQLTALIEKGLADSPTLKKATAKVEMAKQMAKQERSALFPQAWGTAGTNWQYLSPTGFFRSYAPDIPGVVNVIDLDINFSWDVDIWGKNRKRFEAAVGRMHAEEAERAQTELFLCISIAQAYFDLQQLFAQEELLSKLIQIKQDYLDLTSQRKIKGLDNEIETFSAEKNLLMTEKALLQIQELTQIGEHLVKVLIGESPDSCIEIEPCISLFSKPFPLPENLTCNLVIRRPDLMSELWLIEAAAKEVGVAKRDFLPSINLTGFGGLESITFAHLLSLHNKSGSLNPIISLPFFTGGRLTANLKQKRAAFQEAIFEFNELLLRAAGEVADELSSFHLISEQLDVEEMSVETLEKRTALTERQHKEGLKNKLAVITQKEELIGEELLLIELTFRRNISALKLIKALGGGYQ